MGGSLGLLVASTTVVSKPLWSFIVGVDCCMCRVGFRSSATFRAGVCEDAESASTWAAVVKVGISSCVVVDFSIADSERD